MKLALGLCSSVLLTLVACGSSSPEVENTFSPNAGAPAAGGVDPSTGFDPKMPASTGASKPADSLNACATQAAAAVAKPVYLVFAYDQSGSMAGDGKWAAAGAAMKSFFESADSKGINASMTLFPKYTAYPAFCEVGAYAAPDVAVTTLPSTEFGKAIDATAPQPGQGGTPTMAALTGAMGYAQALRATVANDATVALVMVTDGIPEVCTDKGDVGPATLVAATNASTIPTYIVGVGDQLANLNQIAVGGGTKSAFVVSVGDPLKTQSELSAAIKTIRSSALSCDYAIPKAPAGQTFDSQKVNVQYTPGTGAAKVIDYSQSCATGQGWRYDNAANPTRVIACDATCDSIKNTPGGKVDIVFGCATQASGVK